LAANGHANIVARKAPAEIEVAIREGISHCKPMCVGREPRRIHVHLIGDQLVVRLEGPLTPAEQLLVKSMSAARGKALLKQIRSQFIETARPHLETLVLEITGSKPLSLQYDITTVSGEVVLLFTLASAMVC
jgi:uncharacterized protein YbcI